MSVGANNNLRYGLSLPDGGECGDPRFLVELARLAEDAGWEGLFLEDYISFGGASRSPFRVGITGSRR